MPACADEALDATTEPDPEAVELIEGATNGTCVPAGELFLDTYSCVGVRGPGGDPSIEPSSKPDVLDSGRLDNPDLAWVEEQMLACSCICCHNTPSQDEHGPSGKGRSIWDVSFMPAWTDSATDDVVMRIAGIGSPVNAPQIPAEDNHGFSRGPNGGLPTTDLDRIAAFAERELERRMPAR